VRPWSGTFADIELVARRLAAGLRERGVEAGDVVALQLPNWMEAAAAFWAASFLGAVVVPVVHLYGRNEVGYILRVAAPKDPRGRRLPAHPERQGAQGRAPGRGCGRSQFENMILL
jgi:hypothetical protein